MFNVWVTNVCNMKCKYCYEGLEKKTDAMSPETAEKTVKWIIKKAYELNEKNYVIHFHGGEPTLNLKVIFQIIDKLNAEDALKFTYHMTTNALDLTETQLNEISNKFDFISVSLDGNENSNNLNRLTCLGKSTFKNVLKNAHLFKDNNVDFTIRMTVDHLLASKLYENILFFINEGFEKIEAAVDFCDKKWTVEAIDELEQQVKKILSKYPYMRDSEKVLLPFCNNSNTKMICNGGKSAFNISCDGKIYPCTFVTGDKNHVIGDIENGIYQDKIKELEIINLKKLEICSGCGGYNTCLSTRCKLLNKKIQGDYLTPMPLSCELHRRSILFSL